MKNIFITALFILFWSIAIAQTQKIRFASINQLGLLSGSKGESGAIQTINGIRKASWFVGAGAGLDHYSQRTIPLFVDVRRDFTTNRNTPFLYADAGVNILWLTNEQKAQQQFSKTPPGVFYDLGLGWKLSGKNKRGFLFSAGYSLKQVKEKVYQPWFGIIGPSQPESYTRYNYLYRRIVIKIGLEL